MYKSNGASEKVRRGKGKEAENDIKSDSYLHHKIGV